jgi:hypothetical protein
VVAINSEGPWRNALNAKGRDWVTAELQRRSGQPDDVVLDVVFEEPYPTREFCQRWCAEQDNRIFHVSGYTIALLVALVLLISFGIKLVNSWENLPQVQHPARAAPS